MKKKDHTGERFGILTAVKRIPNLGKKTEYLCVCDCGNETTTTGSNLVSGHIKSCVCLSERHGKARKERLYTIWVGMKQRCRDKNSASYSYYGGRGITVCDEWIDDYMVFRKWAFANGYTDDLSIDRINGNGNYCPDNCRWLNKKMQNNNLSSNRIFEHNGKRMTMAELAECLGISYQTLKHRLDRGWDFERIVTTPQMRGGNDTNET